MTASVRPGPKSDDLLPGVNAQESIRGYCYQHDLHPDFLPVPARSVDEWARLKQIKETVANLPKYELTFRRSSYFPFEETGDTHLTRTYLWLTGAFPTHKPQAGMNWYNPNYTHGPEHAAKMHSRDYHLYNAMELPTVTAKEIAGRFGQDLNTVSKYLSRNELHFRQRQKLSKRRLARSILTSAEWGDYTVRELCKAIPNRPTGTVKDWCWQLARNNGWTTPDKPTWTKWYR